jgi:hypothetical protein
MKLAGLQNWTEGGGEKKMLYVLLTVYLGTFFVNNQLNAQFFFMYVYFYSLHVSGRQTCTLNGPLYRVTYTRCRIDTINSSDDGHVAARNMKRIEINIYEKNCASSWLFTKKMLSLLRI